MEALVLQPWVRHWGANFGTNKEFCQGGYAPCDPPLYPFAGESDKLDVVDTVNWNCQLWTI